MGKPKVTNPMKTAAEFLALLKRYGLPADLFKIEEVDDSFFVMSPHGVILAPCWDTMAYFNLHNAVIDCLNNDVKVDFDKFFAPYIADYKIRCERDQLLEDNTKLLEEVKSLRAEIEELRLRPGGPDYDAAKSRFEKLAKQ